MHRLTNEYRLLRRLGSGGMGEVWEAARIKGNDVVVPCAIKLLHGDFTETARERRLFFDEARIATQLDHSRIVKVIDVGTARDGRPFLVMERVDGVDLRGFVRVANKASITHLDFDVIAYIVGEVLAALDYAHGRTVGGSDGGVIHSDVTPGNMLISSSGEVKLTDFGIARFAATAAPMSRAIGTPRYMSPEQLAGQPQRETDIYGLGVVLHELLEGKRFLDGLTPDQFRSRVLMGPPPALEREGVPGWFDELRLKMVATDPSQRPSASEARSVIIEHCRGYLTAAQTLRNDYKKLIGEQRSGVTLLQLEASERRAREIESTPREEPQPEVEIPPTELLPPLDDGEPTADSAAEEPSVELGGGEHLRWVAIAFGLLAVVMGTIAFSLLAKMLREPDPEAEVQAEHQPASQPTPPALAPSPTPTNIELPATPGDSTQNPEGSQPAPVPDPPPVEEAEAVPAEPPEAEKPKPRPKAKALPKIGVVFLVEIPDGRLKAGRTTIPIENRSGYAKLTPGKYEISLQPAGSSDWEAHGSITVKDIGSSRYKVRLKNGKIVEVGEL